MARKVRRVELTVGSSKGHVGMGAFVRPAAQVYRVAGISTPPGAKLVIPLFFRYVSLKYSFLSTYGR